MDFTMINVLKSKIPWFIKKPLRNVINIHNKIKNEEIEEVWEYFVLITMLPLLVLLRLLRPVILVRITRIDASRLGNLALETAGYMSDKDNGNLPPGSFDIFYYTKKICNTYLTKRWSTIMRVWPVRYLGILNKIIPGGDKHVCKIEISPERALKCSELLKAKNNFYLTSEDNNLAMVLLEEKGIKLKDKVVCFFNRDSAYLASEHGGRNWEYHDYRDSKIQNYVQSMEYLANEGYQSFRLGVKVSEKISTDNPNIIDYASNYRSDLLDVYLIDKAKFIVGAASGLGALCQSLRKTVVTVNCAPFMGMDGFPGIHDIYLPKLYWSKKFSRLMTFDEVLSGPSRNFGRSIEYREAGIELIENNADEINDVVSEMHQRISGTWIETNEEKELKHRFNKILNSHSLPKAELPQIGLSFLRKYKELL